jgi:heme/copper-type cytochrome/quinol oxidase subunit 2
MTMSEIGKIIIFMGIIMIILGVLLLFSDKLPFNLGKLPGDISYKKENFSFYFPITTSIVVSIVLTLLFYLFGKFFR